MVRPDRRTAIAHPPIDVDLSGKTALVTGANSGIGKQIAENLAALGAHVILACRSRERGQGALDDIATRVDPERLELAKLDQSSQSSIRELVAEVGDRHPELDVLVNNAGIYPRARELSADGIELTWATNVLGYFLLTRLLEPNLVAAAPARVLFVASTMAGGLDFDDLEWETRRFGGIRAYKQSKQANRMLAWVFADELGDRQVTVHAIHPGGVNTSIARHQKGLWGALVKLAFKTQRSVADGADTATFVAATSAGADQTGVFWDERAPRECEFRDMDACRELWRRCETMIV